MNETANANRLFDGHYRQPAHKTKMATFRIYEKDFNKLKSEYEGNMGLLVRILLEQYLAGHLPEVEQLFKKQFEIRME